MLPSSPPKTPHPFESREPVVMVMVMVGVSGERRIGGGGGGKRYGPYSFMLAQSGRNTQSRIGTTDRNQQCVFALEREKGACASYWM